VCCSTHFLEKNKAPPRRFLGSPRCSRPLLDPTLGGYITDNYGWRWVFFINIPTGLLALWMCSKVVHDPEYLKTQQAVMRKTGGPFDTRGLCLLSLTMICWEVVLSKGQEWDWFDDPFFRVQTLLIVFVLSLGTLVWRELRIRNPLINFRTLGDRNFRWAYVIIFCAFFVLYANTTSLPALLQSLFGYDATTSGLVLSPSGLAAVMMLFVVGLLLSRGVDARWLIGVGLIIMGIGNYWMSRMNLDIGPWQVVWPRVVVIAGLSMIFALLNVAAFLYIPPQLRGAAVGLLALLRNEGGSVGTSVAKTIHERRDQFHSLRLGENLDMLNPAVKSFLHQAQSNFLHLTGDPVAAKRMALQALAHLREQQSSAFAYFDSFFVFATLGVGLAFVVLRMKRSVATKGAHAAAE
jgi:DHA2 family multidrug resistance protein